MKSTIPFKILFILLSCFCLNTLHAQDEDYDEYLDDPYKESYEERMRNFDNNLQEARDYFQNQDDQARIARTYKKIDEGLQGFLETAFMEKFKDLRLEVESQAASFKAYSETLRPEEVIKVKKAYIKISDQSNKLLHDIKRDFLDQKKLKHIRKYPDMYSASLELRLRNLQDDYSDDFERVIADITGSDQYSAAPLMAIFGIIKFAVDFTNYLSRVRYDNRRVKEEHLELHFIEPFRFRTWDEIETISANIYGNDTEFNEESGEDNYEMEEPMGQPDSSRVINPFEEDKQSLKPKSSPTKRKKN